MGRDPLQAVYTSLSTCGNTHSLLSCNVARSLLGRRHRMHLLCRRCSPMRPAAIRCPVYAHNVAAGSAVLVARGSHSSLPCTMACAPSGQRRLWPPLRACRTATPLLSMQHASLVKVIRLALDPGLCPVWNAMVTCGPCSSHNLPRRTANGASRPCRESRSARLHWVAPSLCRTRRPNARRIRQR